MNRFHTYWVAMPQKIVKAAKMTQKSVCIAIYGACCSMRNEPFPYPDVPAIKFKMRRFD